MKRTDVHKPSTFNPKNYRAVGYVDIGKVGIPSWNWMLKKEFGPTIGKEIEDQIALVAPGLLTARARQWWPDLIVSGSATGRIDRCSHCGAAIVRIVVAEHVPTGNLLPVGVVCAERVEMPNIETLEIHSNSKKRKALQIEILETVLRTTFVKEAQFVDRHWWTVLMPDGDPQRMIRAIACQLDARKEAIDIALNTDPNDPYVNKWDKPVLANVKRDGWCSTWYGDKIVRIKDERDRKEALAQNAPAIRNATQRVTGKIKRWKWKEGSYGSWLKLTVEDDDGNRFYVTCPKNVLVTVNNDPRLLEGRYLGFDAEVEAAQDDPHFGFCRKPRNAMLA